jgi:hypothetical protein
LLDTQYRIVSVGDTDFRTLAGADCPPTGCVAGFTFTATRQVKGTAQAATAGSGRVDNICEGVGGCSIIPMQTPDRQCNAQLDKASCVLSADGGAQQGAVWCETFTARRPVRCIEDATGLAVADSFCDLAASTAGPKPDESYACPATPDCVYEWVIPAFPACPALACDLDPAPVAREVRCKMRDGRAKETALRGAPAAATAAAALVRGRLYAIEAVGTTNFAALGASCAPAGCAAGVTFTASGPDVGAGTGTARLVTFDALGTQVCPSV